MRTPDTFFNLLRCFPSKPPPPPCLFALPELTNSPEKMCIYWCAPKFSWGARPSSPQHKSAPAHGKQLSACLFGWWLVLVYWERKYCWLVGNGWFIMREKYQ
jgi:hypothetical protein